MTGLEIIKSLGTTAGEIADIISQPCPPVIPETCDRLSCRECWLAWLVTGEPPGVRGGGTYSSLWLRRVSTALKA